MEFTKQPILKVGIMTAAKVDFVLETSFHYNTVMLPKGSYNIELKGNKFILQGAGFFTITEEDIALLPMFRTNSFLLRNVTIGSQFHWEQTEDLRFTGGLRFIREESKIRVINTIHLEDYLKSVISSEMSANSSPELLKAHAVISRSWLLAQMEKNKSLEKTGDSIQSETITDTEVIRWYDREDHDNFDVCGDDHCQRYHGITRIISARAMEATEDTSGMVLVTESGICDARYSKCCGGVTESFETNWEPHPKSYLVPVADTLPLGSFPPADLRQENEAVQWITSHPGSFCNTSDKHILKQVLPGFDQQTTDFYRWTVTYSQEELSSMLTSRSGYNFGQILRLEPMERGYSGRITRLRIIGTSKTIVVGKELEIRKWLSATHLYSSAFVVEYGDTAHGIPGKFILRGAGWGHGTGLCQIGAAVMGEKGYSFEKILAHYFHGANLKKLY